jgi:hypothetical protein
MMTMYTKEKAHVCICSAVLSPFLSGNDVTWGQLRGNEDTHILFLDLCLELQEEECLVWQKNVR